MENIVIVGAGGLGREIEWLINRINEKNKKYNILGYIDDTKEKNTKITEYSVIENVDGIKNLEDDINVIVAIGSSKDRKIVVDKIKNIKKVRFPNLIDPAATIDEKMLKGEGNIICAGVIATVNIEMNSFNIINLNCTVGHDVRISNFVTVYPSASISGNVTIGECTEIGTGTRIIQKLNIGSNSIIGAGSVVIRDIESNVTAVGVPTRILQK